ncbi:TetR/AcrR family transcriptional regulator [Sphingobium sp. CAP-1]|uniref:TetR/AcrR family transcriptional regulator n=1 Tax=Sphingobium sp. CAP-1 TaxID=2676077 RepID=UPI0012BB2744|nr:TetR/AcrR family transcriptional regulator [Sphingobium sp. CAP-1]QGP78879.1 TetR family transcriptional regulator [Sphingobium sp. CAP-1]
MIDKEKSKGRGRPRAFDRDRALDQAQALFHAQGYEGVGVAALAEAMGVNPPSLYAAFGSKAGLFEQVLDRYARAALPVDALLAEGAEPVAALTALLRTAAALYTADPRAPGCLVLEGARGADPDAALRARVWREASAARVRAFVALSHPDKADVVADYMVTIMSGLSADARAGQEAARLAAVADMAALAIAAMLAKG